LPGGFFRAVGLSKIEKPVKVSATAPGRYPSGEQLSAARPAAQLGGLLRCRLRRLPASGPLRSL
jgi:hypothetical protein